MRLANTKIKNHKLPVKNHYSSLPSTKTKPTSSTQALNSTTHMRQNPQPASKTPQHTLHLPWFEPLPLTPTTKCLRYNNEGANQGNTHRTQLTATTNGHLEPPSNTLQTLTTPHPVHHHLSHHTSSPHKSQYVFQQWLSHTSMIRRRQQK